jgi:hypothetical protein
MEKTYAVGDDKQVYSTTCVRRSSLLLSKLGHVTPQIAADRRGLQPLLHNRLTKFLSLLREASVSGKPVDLSRGYRSLTSDVVMTYCFADQGFNTLDVEDFNSPNLRALEHQFNTAQYAFYFEGIFVC